MKLIGHRGAAGLALENTEEAIKAAIKAGVDAVEFDIRTTKDGKLLLSHDPTLERISGGASTARISKSELADLLRIPLIDNKRLISLDDALRFCGNTPIFIEGKYKNWAKPLAQTLMHYKYIKGVTVISFHQKELMLFRKLMPEVPVYILNKTNPFEAIDFARRNNLNGVDLVFWIVNPISYTLARYHKLDVATFTVNSPFIARIFKVLYPRLQVTTNHPHKMKFLRQHD